MHTEFLAPRDSVEEVLRAGADVPACQRDLIRDLLIREAASIALACPVHDEGDRPHRAFCRDGRHPAGQIPVTSHFSPPDWHHFGRQIRTADLVSDTDTRAAPIQREHDARTVASASKAPLPKAEAPMPALYRGHPALGELYIGLPHERAIGEQPELLAHAGLV